MFTKYTESHLTHEFSHKALESSRELLVVLGSSYRSRGIFYAERRRRGKGDLCVISPLRLCNGMMSAAGLLESFAAVTYAAWKILSNVVCEPPGLGIDTILRRSQPAARACSCTFMPFYHQVCHSDIFPDIH